MTRLQTPVVLCILDGWGCAPPSETNAISRARTPHWDKILNTFPQTRLQASETFVGLPKGQMGNSEVGHMTIGSGRLLSQDLPRLTAAFQEGTAHTKPAFQTFVQKLHKTGGTAHVMGLLSPGGVHSHQSHFLACVNNLSDCGIPVAVHAFLDGRDTPPQSAKSFLASFLEALEGNPSVHLASLGGRYFAMDRDQRWDRIEQAYDALVRGQPKSSLSPEALIQAHYDKGITDEFIPPHCLASYEGMQDGDGLFMVNFRSDRARQILRALLLPDFAEFERGRPPLFGATLGMTPYAEDITPLMPPLFPPEVLKRPLGSVLSEAGFTQLRLAETEKYAHVTFFFNGGREAPFPGEDRILVPSPAVSTYDLKPEMSAAQVTARALESLEKQVHDFLVMNFANTDMVGHTGNLDATIQAVEAVDTCLGRLQEAVLKEKGTLLITADHGNAEHMWDGASCSPHTAHTTNLVPFVCVSQHLGQATFAQGQGTLADIAPTILALLGLPQEQEMTGTCLLSFSDSLPQSS